MQPQVCQPDILAPVSLVNHSLASLAIHVCIAALACLCVCLVTDPQQDCCTLLTLVKATGAPGRQSSMGPIVNLQPGDGKGICAITLETKCQ